MIKKEWFWMSNYKRQKEEHCHYSGLPSPMAYESKKVNKMKKNQDVKQAIFIAMLSMAVLIGMVIILL
jgi:hypothetical protein|tara:strand:+ start:1613 stop:1816 length:204 start_codon:yes stop_codon:yes gene_type:complete